MCRSPCGTSLTAGDGSTELDEKATHTLEVSKLLSQDRSRRQQRHLRVRRPASLELPQSRNGRGLSKAEGEKASQKVSSGLCMRAVC